jgi:hypothetical protein
MCANRTSIWLKRIAVLILLTVGSASAASAQTAQASGATVVRQSDSLVNGALIGAGVAVASGLFICTRMEPWDNCRDDVGPMLRLGAIGAGIGIGIDALIRKKVYQSASGGTVVHAAPMLGRRVQGLRLSVKF